MRTTINLDVNAPVDRLWFALTDPCAVVAWAGVTPADVPHDYPRPRQHATWWDGAVLLHDEIVAVDPQRRLASRLRRGSHHAVEDYRLTRTGRATSRLLATWRGSPRLADNARSMRLLKEWCET